MWLTNIFESFSSFYYIISTLIAVTCLVLIWIWTIKFLNSPSPAQKNMESLESKKRKTPLRMAKEIENSLSPEKKILEQKVKAEQLEAVFKLMQQHSDLGNMSKEDLDNQMKLYGF